MTGHQALVGTWGTAEPPDHGVVRVADRTNLNNTLYRTLTMASGAHITVNGALEVSGQTDCYPVAGGPKRGYYSEIQMETNTSITVNGKLYAWGHIKGSGTVTVNSGAEVYENLSIMDYQGSADTMSDINNGGAFPLCRFVLDAVQVKLTLKEGSDLKVFFCIYGNSIGYNTFVLTFAGANGTFKLNSGDMELYYQNSRQKIIVYGNVTVTPLTASATAMGTTVEINSSKTSGFPMGRDWDVVLKSGGTMTANESILMLAGSTLTTEAGSDIVVTGGKNITILDADTDPSDATADPVIDINGTITVNIGTFTKSSTSYVSGIYSTAGTTDNVGIISSQGTGKIIVANVPNAPTVTLNNGAATEFNVAPVKLTNRDSSKLDTAKGGANTYTYSNNKWHCATHTWDAGTVTTPAGCETAGKTTYNCTVCGDTKTEDIAATGHNYSSVVTAPTCTAQGYTTYTCSCGDSYKDSYVDATGHNYNSVVTAPTCTVQGYTTHTCSKCGDTYTDTPVAATGHSWVAADCDTPKTCSVCSATEGSALGHSWDAGSVTANPTCSAEGVKTFTCGTCGETKTEPIATLPHTEVVDAAVAPTCTATGLTEGKHCSVCGTVTVAQTTVAAKGHSYNEEITTEPGCESTGVKTYTCGTCGDSYTEEIAATGHSYTSSVTTAATCTANGVKTYTCSGCDDTYTETIPATGHTNGTAVTENNVAATCTADGSYDSVIYCTVCSAEVSRTTTTVDATGHNEIDVDAVAPTCTETGLTAGKKCSVCGTVTVAQTEVAALGHKYDSVVTAPTCTEKGYTTHTCSVCSDSYQDSEVAALGHTYP